MQFHGAQSTSLFHLGNLKSEVIEHCDRMECPCQICSMMYLMSFSDIMNANDDIAPRRLSSRWIPRKIARYTDKSVLDDFKLLHFLQISYSFCRECVTNPLTLSTDLHFSHILVMVSGKFQKLFKRFSILT